jgi:hypothetical protein
MTGILDFGEFVYSGWYKGMTGPGYWAGQAIRSTVTRSILWVKEEKVPLLPSKAPFSKRFEDAVGQACESSAASCVARRFPSFVSTPMCVGAENGKLAGQTNLPFRPLAKSQATR